MFKKIQIITIALAILMGSAIFGITPANAEISAATSNACNQVLSQILQNAPIDAHEAARRLNAARCTSNVVANPTVLSDLVDINETHGADAAIRELNIVRHRCKNANSLGNLLEDDNRNVRYPLIRCGASEDWLGIGVLGMKLSENARLKGTTLKEEMALFAEWLRTIQ